MKSVLLILSRSLIMSTAIMSSALLAEETSLPKSTETTPPFSVTPELQTVPVEEIEKAFEGKTPPEAIRMYLAIVKGSRMGAGEGWFGPAQTHYNWNWLASLHSVDSDEGIVAQDFKGPSSWFARLDRNRDGKITAEDLDWSDRNPWVQQAYLVNRLFRKIDPNGDGHLTREEWMQFFDTLSDGKNEITSDQLRDAWLGGMSSGFLSGDAPTPEILLKGLFSGEVGSLQEGPQVDEIAPDFTLMTHDGRTKIRLSEVVGSKPVVLVFGNFTCGPFRSLYAGVEEIYGRFKDDAVFLGIYVREAHPTDGWKMESNAKVGVSVAQPKSYAERAAVAGQCHALLKYSIPLLVDDIDDPTGNAYSGMPARLYVLDRSGRVAYKSGRGPFGFKTGEMEQALLMTMLKERNPEVATEDAAASNSGK